MSAHASPLRTPALVGFALFAFASGGLGLLARAPFLWAFDLPVLHIVAAAVATAGAWWALRALDARLLAGAAALGVALLASAANGLPTIAGWALALAGGLGFLVYVENAVLLVRLEKVAEAEGEGTAEALKGIAVEARSAEMRPLLLVAGLLLAAVLLARTLFLVVDPGLANSLEAGGGYGLVVMALLLAVGVYAYGRARGRAT